MSRIMTPGTKLFHTLHTVAVEHRGRAQPWYKEGVAYTSLRRALRPWSHLRSDDFASGGCSAIIRAIYPQTATTEMQYLQ
jgi:hypothetical protein